MEASQTILFGF